MQNLIRRGKLLNMDYSSPLTERFSKYFERDIAQTAAKSLNDGIEMEFRVENEVFTFTKSQGRNQVIQGNARDPQLLFNLTPLAAEAVLNDTNEEIAPIAIHIVKLILSPDQNKKISVRFKAGFLTLFSGGYFGVLATGGGQLTSYLASQGLNGIGAIKTLINKLKD